MIKVYEHGMYWKKVQCQDCKCLFGYSEIMDTQLGQHSMVVYCPECNAAIKTNENNDLKE